MSGRSSYRVDALIDVIQRQRGLLERLRYRYVALELMIDAGEVRFLDWALQDLNRARIQLREVDLARATTVGLLDIDGARAVVSLREVAAAAGAPWSGILRDHHDSLSTLVAEIELHAHTIAQHGHDWLGELARTGTVSLPAPPTVDHAPVAALVGAEMHDGPGLATCLTPTGVGRLRAPGAAEDLDPLSLERLLDDMIATAGRLRMPALLAFLR